LLFLPCALAHGFFEAYEIERRAGGTRFAHHLKTQGKHLSAKRGCNWAIQAGGGENLKSTLSMVFTRPWVGLPRPETAK